MNILIISDQFKKGGLVTHIETYYNYLKKNNKVVYIFGKCDNEEYLKNALIYKDLCKFNETPTIEEFCDDVQKIVDIVKKEKIEKDIELYKKEIAEISIKNVFKKSLNEWILKIKNKWRK